MSNLKLEPRTPSDSHVTMTEIVLPQHTNALGTIFGGTIMSWIDVAAAITAYKHSRQSVVTASIDALSFLAPVRLGHIVYLRASVNFTGRSSMEVGVRVDSEDPITGTRSHTASAYTTFVAVNKQGEPQPVAPIKPETEDEKRRYRAAEHRREARVELAKKIKGKT